MPRLRSLASLLVLVVLVSGVAVAQDRSKDKPKGQLPPNWKALGLSDEQRTKVYEIQSEYRSKIDALESQVKDLRKQQAAALDKVLTSGQRTKLREIIASKVPGAEERKDSEKKP